MNGPDRNEDWIQRIAAAVWIGLCLIGLAVLLSGHGVVSDPSAPRIAPSGTTATVSGDRSTP